MRIGQVADINVAREGRGGHSFVCPVKEAVYDLAAIMQAFGATGDWLDWRAEDQGGKEDGDREPWRMLLDKVPDRQLTFLLS